MSNGLHAMTRFDLYFAVSMLYLWLSLLSLEVPHQGLPGFLVTVGPLVMMILYLVGALRERQRAARG
jgi:steroid 5-alpha reductase family enzyme